MPILNMHLIVAVGCVLTASVAALPMLYGPDELNVVASNSRSSSSSGNSNSDTTVGRPANAVGAGGPVVGFASDIDGPDNDSYELNDIIKREPKRYGKSHRSAGYSYLSSGSSGVKRLPIYNFGLGRKRSSPIIGGSRAEQEFQNRPYMFGLGKRSGEADASSPLTDEDLIRLAILLRAPLARLVDEELDAAAGGASSAESAALASKRSRSFDFGLGKRDGVAVERRRYNFGLGR